MSDKTVCPRCGYPYKSLGNHWQRSSKCGYPKIPERISETLNKMAEDAQIIMTSSHTNPSLKLRVKTQEEVDGWMDGLGWMAAKPYPREHKVNEFISLEYFVVVTRRHPHLRRFVDDSNGGEDGNG